jgi:predicted nucleotidyltransferase
MTNILQPDGVEGCFRCANVWRARSTAPTRCPRCKSKLWDVPKLRAVRRGNGLGINDIIQPKRDQLFSVLKAHSARSPRVFGSIARSEASPTSDLDLIVDFDEGASMLDQAKLRWELQELFGRKVDVTSPNGLHWLIRPQVLFEAVTV